MHVWIPRQLVAAFSYSGRERERPIPKSSDERIVTGEYEGIDRRGRDPDRQHHRREDDSAEFVVNIKKLALYAGAVISILTLVAMVAAFFGSKIATQTELDDVTDTLSAFRKSTTDHHYTLDLESEALRQQITRIGPLVSALAKSKCLEIADQPTGAPRRDAIAVGLPCDSLMPGVFQQRIDRSR